MGDLGFEPDETFFVNLSNPTNATILDAQGEGTIFNDDPIPQISISDASVIEGNLGTATATFTVGLSAPSHEVVTVQYATSDDTAASADDYGALALTTLSFAPGEVSKVIAVEVQGDFTFERDETFFVNLSNPSNATLLDAQAQGTILNDEPIPQISISDASVSEGNTGTAITSFTVTLSGPSALPVSVQYATANDTALAPEDYTALALTTLTFAPGEVSKIISVEVHGDYVAESDETFFVNLTNSANSELLDAQGLITIITDDSAVVVSPIAGGRGITFTDSDGDRIVVKTNKGTLSAANFAWDLAGNISLINLTTGSGSRSGAADFTNAKLKVSAKAQAGGDGQINVRFLDASGLRLKSVQVDGDISRIDVGEGLPGRSALKKLTAQSIGLGDIQDTESTISGTLGVLRIKDHVVGVINVTGGLAENAGDTGNSDQVIKKVVVGGNIDGRSGGAKAGLILATGAIGNLTVKGSVIGGADLSGIIAGGTVGTIAIGGDLRSDDAHKPVTVSAVGLIGARKQSEAVAFKQVRVEGNVLNAEILAGVRHDGTPTNADAGIGKIIVDGNWTASSAVAGVEDVTNDGYGINDTLIGGGVTGLLSRIASITIGGQVSGSAVRGEHFGVTAEQIGKLKIGRARQPVSADNSDNLSLADGFAVVDFA